MALSSRQLFDISVLLNTLYDRTKAADNALRLASQTMVNVNSLVLDGLTPRDKWEHMLRLADGQEKVVMVLGQVAIEYPENSLIKLWISELETGFMRRVRLMAEMMHSQQCVLFLGPGMLQYRQNGNLVPFGQVLAEQLANEIDGNVYFDQKARSNLNYMVQRYLEQTNIKPVDLSVRAQTFFNDSRLKGRIDEGMHHQLAELPFRVIINTNPDNLLAEHINRTTPGRCAQRYYNVANDTEARLDTQNRPTEEVLHYNIFGSFDQPTSVLFTESNLLNFTKRILRDDPPLDPAVLREFDENKYYLFLGFDFEHWNMKIVFDMVLQLVKKTDRAFSIFPASVSVGTFNREFFEKEFQMYFIQEDLNVFLTALVNSYQQQPATA